MVGAGVPAGRIYVVFLNADFYHIGRLSRSHMEPMSGTFCTARPPVARIEHVIPIRFQNKRMRAEPVKADQRVCPSGGPHTGAPLPSRLPGETGRAPLQKAMELVEAGVRACRPYHLHLHNTPARRPAATNSSVLPGQPGANFGNCHVIRAPAGLNNYP